MWKDSGQDPGGGPFRPDPQQLSTSSNQELFDLKDQCEQQQVLIAQLKEVLRKNDQTNVTQEKVDEYMNTLTRMNARVKKSKRKDNNDEEDNNTSRPIIDIAAKSKIDLLRQQVAENKAKLAERDKSQKGIEEMVTQIQAQLDDSQQWINQTPLNLSIQDSKIDYNQNSSSDELYNILLIKEKRITELVNKNQKLESNIFDLHENLKEKDSVIDARTKAITLMTENLTKKSKGTLDALDETKEQMRKMQENFIKLESEMKARQMKLLDDLRLKNYEIAELQEFNNKLEQDKQELNEKITEISERNEFDDLTKRIQQLEELNAQLQQNSNENSKTFKIDNDLQMKFDHLQNDYDKLLETVKGKDDYIENLQKTIKDLENQQAKTGDNNNDEINKLKKQLDENNKNMIKIKAQNKSKIKQLTKKIEDFKKIADVNAEFVKLETENCKLTQKIAELEEEKGSLQLKLMESDTSKGTQREVEENKDKQLEDNLTTISTLENEISSLKMEIESLTEKLNNSPSFEHVKSEMTSIQFEEQFDEHLKLIQTNQEIINGKDEKIELLLKEKQELTIKLENYIQENMELIDKLEKLSAEKVSSAESIEIVEGLTQQEKLELEAYQKVFDSCSGTNNNNNNNDNSNNNTNNLKASDENLPQVDLNETVNELTEETSELLQKIELFTIERREVMEKMEQLKHENNNLILKMNEIENNRDILAETYEQLQNEKEDLIKKFDEIQQENDKLHAELKTNTNSSELNEQLRQLADENQQLLIKLDENDRLRNEQEDFESQLNELKHTNEELIKEIEDYKISIVEMNNLTYSIEQLKQQLESSIEENGKLKIRLDELENIKNDLDKEIRQYQNDLDNIECENRKLLERKDNEIEKLLKERDNIQSTVEDLQQTIQKKDDNLIKLNNELKEKYLFLQKQLDDNSNNLENIKQPFEQKIDELTKKNKEQLEKMKKIAANLKKKTQAYHELENEYKQNQLKWIDELKEKDLQIVEHQNRNTNLLQQLKQLENDIHNLHELSNEKSQQLQHFENKNIDLQNTIIELRTKLDKINETNLQEELLQTKENIIDIETNENNMLKSKIQELEMLIEMKDNELLKLNERIIKLDDCIRFVEERRMSLEKKAIELGTELEEKKQNVEEITKYEDLLEKRLIALVEHDEIIEKKLENSISENNELNQQISKLNHTNDELKKKLDELEDKLQKLDSLENTFAELENHNTELERIKQNLENDVKNLHNDYNKIINESNDEFDKMNNDWQQQFDEMFKEKTELMAHCQRLEDELKVILNNENSFNNELILYKNKLENSEIEIRNYEEQIGQLLAENQIYSKQEQEINDLKQQLNEKINELKHTNEQLSELEVKNNECDILRKKIVSLETELLSKTAENTVKSVVEQAENQVNCENDIPTTQIPTIIWSDQSNDPFDFLTNQTTTDDNIAPIQDIPLTIQPQQEDLQNKLKTLEFMLFNVGKERDDAYAQCKQLTNELTKFVYEKITSPDFESQIIPNDQLLENNENLQRIEYEPTESPVIHSMTEGPINEEICERKSAYLCYPDNKSQQSDIDSQTVLANVSTNETTIQQRQDSGNSQQKHDTFGENEDGWGWSPEEVRLEEEHANKNDDNTIDILNNKIRVLEIEREKHLDEIKQLQIKSGKLIKKLKEFKIKNDELNRTKKLDDVVVVGGGGGFNLDDTIQEELKLQLEQIEKRLNETINDLEKERFDKQSLQKKNDLLITTNQRMIEMKEKYDMELLSCQQNCHELNTKLERYEWGQDDGFNNSEQQNNDDDDDNDKINQLNETIKELTLDNDELQKLLEEQRQLRVQAEKSKIIDNTTNEDRINECALLKNEILLNNEKQKQLQCEINELTVKLDEALHKIGNIKIENDKLHTIIIEKTTIIEQLNETIKHHEAQLITINQLQKEKNELLNELQMKDIEINSIQIELENSNQNINNLNGTIQLNQNEIHKLTNELQQHNDERNLLNNEWQIRVDQRGADVAESWKLHVDSRENEFKQIEENFKKEIIELDEKCNGLVNENNELRKNVDIEIRNEVDRIANLQQQINERQQIINDLTKQLHDKQLEIEQLNDNVTQLNVDINQLNQTIITKDDGLDEKQQLIESILKELHIDLNDNNLVVLNCEKFYKDFENNCRQLEEIKNSEVLLKHELQQKNETITNLMNQIQHIQNLKEYENENIENLQQNIMEYQQINATINAQLQENNKRYEYLNHEYENNQMLLQERNNEIVNLKLKFNETDEITQQQNSLINQQLQEIELLKHHLDDNQQLLNMKNADIENLQIQFNEQLEKINDYIEKLKQFDIISNELQQKINETIILQQKITEQNQLIDDENKQLTELRDIIEDQVMKIENLKHELYEKSNDYDSLIAEMDMSLNNEHKQIKEEYRQQQQQQQHDDDDLSEAVSRAELDFALYMFHQRDVRCEELTMELTQLLEERDTLQLRLSNALREKEEIYNRLKIDENAVSSTEPNPTIIGNDPITIGNNDKSIKDNQLDNKISELKTVGYKRDKTIVDEQELRRVQEFSILQQHKDIATKLPPEAAARLVDASYTLSRDVQSPSKVLMNWLWGKSTPKVNNI